MPILHVAVLLLGGGSVTQTGHRPSAWPADRWKGLRCQRFVADALPTDDIRPRARCPEEEATGLIGEIDYPRCASDSGPGTLRG